MKNTETVARISEHRITPLYYSPAENAVYTEPGAGRWYLTDLIRKNSPQEIEDTVRRFMAL